MATFRSRRFPFLVILVAACAQRGCEPLDPLLAQFADTFGSVVPAQPADPTPPTVTLTIPDLGSGQISLTPTSSPVNISLKPGQSFFVIASAEDPEGVKEVGFRGSFAIECSYEGEVSTASTGLQGPSDVDLSSNGQAFTKR